MKEISSREAVYVAVDLIHSTLRGDGRGNRPGQVVELLSKIPQFARAFKDLRSSDLQDRVDWVIVNDQSISESR